ncbi:MAG: fimbrillin family protein, partial [Muribaculaceae bacterium]|nr:fimbrillin family protein [Muribaculaceae bacterium]
NIREGGSNGVYRYDFTEGKYPDFPGCNADGTVKDGLAGGIMQFTKNGSSEVGKFDLGHLIFRHALTRITVKLIAGEGYDPATAFSVEHVKINNVTLTNDATTLNVTDGLWSGAVSGKTIDNMSLLTTPDAGCHRQLVAHTIPGDVIPQGGTTKRVEIVVDGNIYYLTDKMLYESFSALAPGNGVTIDGTNVKLEQSKNYEINVRVSKKRIDEITATVVPWATVAGKEKEVNNAYISLKLYDSATGTKIVGSNPPKFYRLDDPSDDFIFEDDAWKHYAWYTKYVRHSDDLEWDATNNCWKSKWYFENNHASYHFRMTNADDGDINLAPAAGDPFAGADYLNITSNSTDTWWGAPMKSGANLVYDFTNDSRDTSSPKGGYSSSLH